MTKDLAASSFFAKMGEEAPKWAQAHGVDITVLDLGTNADAAITAVDTAIGAGVQGIVITVPSDSIGPAISERAAAANVPMLALFDSFKDGAGKANPFYGLDDLGFGKIAGEEIVRLYNAAGWASDASLVVRGAQINLSTVPVCFDAREKGAADAIKQGIPGFTDEDIIKVPYKGDEESSISAMATTITAHPEVTNWLIWSCNDFGAGGAVRALEAAGVPADRAIAVGHSGDLACAEFGKSPPTSYKASTYIDNVAAMDGALAAVYDAVVNGVPLPPVTGLPPVLITPDNYRELLGC